jgi:hypothetical protein
VDECAHSCARRQRSYREEPASPGAPHDQDCPGKGSIPQAIQHAEWRPGCRSAPRRSALWPPP